MLKFGVSILTYFLRKNLGHICYLSVGRLMRRMLTLQARAPLANGKSILVPVVATRKKGKKWNQVVKGDVNFSELASFNLLDSSNDF